MNNSFQYYKEQQIIISWENRNEPKGGPYRSIIKAVK